MSNRLFGIELEFYPSLGGEDYSDGECNCYECRGDRDGGQEFDDVFEGISSDLGNWVVDTDGSLEWHGIEISSPVFTDPESGFREIKRALDVIKRYGAEVDESCGLHVHHDASDYSENDYLRLLRSWSNNQGIINMMVAEHRLHNQYCEPWEVSHVDQVAEYYRDAGYLDIDDKYRAIYPGTYHGTIEIRQHEATLDFDEIKSWVLFGQAFIDSVKERKRPIVRVKSKNLLRSTKTNPEARRILNKKLAMKGVV